MIEKETMKQMKEQGEEQHLERTVNVEEEGGARGKKNRIETEGRDKEAGQTGP